MARVRFRLRLRVRVNLGAGDVQDLPRAGRVRLVRGRG